MKRHLAYLKYVLRHKWFVFLACRRCGASLWRAVIHDWHKFLPSEWFSYAETFYTPAGVKQYLESIAFCKAWNLHQKRGKHHWQHWLLTFDRGETVPIEMDEKYAREMVADWWGAGRAITGRWGAYEWYQENRDKIMLQESTRNFVESLLEVTNARFRKDEAMLAKRLAILGY